MRVKAAATVTAAVFGIALWIPATAAADDIVWNPFLFIPYCSTCGPLVPLTTEQADARDILPAGVLSGVPPISDPGPIDDGVVSIPVPPPPVDPGGSSNGGAPPVQIQIPSSGGNGNNGGGNGGGGNSGGGNSGGGNSGGGGGNGGGIDYTITVTPPGPNGGPGDGNGNPPTFGIGDGPGGGGIDLPPSNPSDGGHEGQTLVPEPTTLLLLGSGLSAAALRRRRARRIEK